MARCGRWTRAWSAALVAAAGAPVLGGAAHAQAVDLRAPPVPGFSAIIGVIDDSLRGRPFAGATVVVVGTQRRGVADDEGIFRIDSVPAGEVQLVVRHPLLDTLFVTVTSSRFTARAGQVEQIGFSTPTLALLRDRICPRGGVIAGSAMLVGRVDEADSDRPVAGATVSLVYADPASAAPTTQRVRSARTRDDGQYAICGLPDALVGSVQVSVGANSTSEIPIAPNGERLSTASFLLGPGRRADSSARGTAVLRGRVTDATGRPVQDAQVAVEGGNVIAVTRADGTFVLENLASGTTSAVVRKIGYTPVTRTVHLRSSQPQVIAASMTAGVRTLAQVTVTADADPALRKVGFMERRNIGIRSNFMLPEDIARRQPMRLTDLIRGLNGFRVNAIGPGQIVESTRLTGGQQGCVVFYVDRVAFEQMSPGDVDAAFPVHQIGAIEAYPSANDTPAEFRMPGRNCATIVAWTRQKLSKP
jgi:hypothetical protein